jgi:hypothetical protein
MEILLRRDFGPVLRPCDETGELALKRVGQGKIVTCNIKQPRNPQHHRLFFALMSKVFQNQEYFKTIEQMVTALKIALGHTDTIKTRRGEFVIPKSISFANMDQPAFDDFYNRAVDFVLAEVIPGLGRAELEAEIREMVGA